MKLKIKTYTFNPTAKTIVFTDYTTIKQDGIIAIINTTAKKEIYNPLKQWRGWSVGTGSPGAKTLTLEYDTSAMNANDKLMIMYEDDTQSLYDRLVLTYNSVVNIYNYLVSMYNNFLGWWNTVTNQINIGNQALQTARNLTDTKGIPALDKINWEGVVTSPFWYTQYTSDYVTWYYDYKNIQVNGVYQFKKWDRVWFTSLNDYRTIADVQTWSSTIILSEDLSGVPSYYETIYIYRKINPYFDSNGYQMVTVSNMGGGSGSQVEVVKDRVNGVNYWTQYFQYYGQVWPEFYNIDAFSELTVNFWNDTGWSGSYYIECEASTDWWNTWESAQLRDSYWYATSSIYYAKWYTFDCRGFNAVRFKCWYSTNPSHYSSVTIHGKPIGKHVQMVELANGLSGTVSVNQSTSPWAMWPYRGNPYSYTTNLTANQALNTGGIYVNSLSEVMLRIVTTQNSATDGLVIEQSRDNSNWDKVFVPEKVLIQTAWQPFYKRIPVKMPYLRVRYTNGAVATTGTNGFNMHIFGLGTPMNDTQSDVNGNQFVCGANVPTFSACTAVFTPPTTPTDAFEITGSANKDIQILKIVVSGKATSATQTKDWTIRKRSTNDTAGTSVATTKVPFDSTKSAPTATVRHYTANPTVWTDVGILHTESLTVPANYGKIWEIDFTQMLNAQPYMLNAVTESLVLNLWGISITGLELQVSVLFTELPL